MARGGSGVGTSFPFGCRIARQAEDKKEKEGHVVLGDGRGSRGGRRWIEWGGGIGIGDEERKKRLVAMKEGAAERERQRKLIEKEIKADQEHR